jgi:hypothetical protein
MLTLLSNFRAKRCRMTDEPQFDIVESPAKLRERAARFIARAEADPANSKELLDMAAQYAAMADRLELAAR